MLIWLHSAQGSIWNRRLQIAVLWPVARCLVVEWEQQQDVALVHLELMQPCDPCLHWRRTSRGSCFIADYCSKLVEELFGYLQILCYCRVFWIIKRVVLKNCFVIFNHLSLNDSGWCKLFVYSVELKLIFNLLSVFGFYFDGNVTINVIVWCSICYHLQYLFITECHLLSSVCRQAFSNIIVTVWATSSIVGCPLFLSLLSGCCPKIL
jgi:hypothetical protein